MRPHDVSSITLNRPTLAYSGSRAFIFQIILIASTVILPVAAHLTGAPVRILLPMHWPVILAGLIYGWRAGLLTGLLAPIVSYLISGFPLPNILPSMILELAVYGMVTGFLREVLRFNPFASIAIALFLGRAVFVLSVLFGSNIINTTYLEYFQVALFPGAAAAIFQIILLPLIAKWWIDKERQNE
jgi:uncharacterized membrane protein